MSGSDFSRTSEAESAIAPPAAGRWVLWPWLVFLIAAVLVAVYLLRGPQGRSGAGADHPAVGTRIEELQLTPLTGDGSPISIGDLKGRVTLINFWGPWCPPCRMEFPHVMEIERHFRGDQRFQLLSISCSGRSGSDEEMGSPTAEFLEEQRATFPTYRDPYQVFMQYLMKVAKLDDFVFPTSVVVDQSGVIRGLWQGYLPGDERELTRVVEATLLADK